MRRTERMIRRDLRTARITEADAYLAARTGSYEKRCVRYDAALSVMGRVWLPDSATVVDVGSGWGEFGVRLHTGDRQWGNPQWCPDCHPDNCSDCGPGRAAPSRARYIPVDACIDGTDLEHWTPPRQADWFVALEVIEHLADPIRLVGAMQAAATRGVIVSTPNPATTDVLGMDPTHRTAVHRPTLEACGFTVTEESFYGQPADSLFGVWRA